MSSARGSNRLQDGLEVIKFELYIAGRTESHMEMIQSFIEYMKEYFPYPHSVEIFDVFVDNRITEMRKVMATPTLVKVTPPSFRIIGDLTQADKLVEKILILSHMAEDESK